MKLTSKFYLILGDIKTDLGSYLLGSLAVVIFAFSAVAVSSAWVDQAHAAGMGKPKPR